MERAGLLWRTVRHLRPTQVAGRVWFRAYRPKPDLAPAPAVRPVSGLWSAPARRRPCQTGPETFRFLNRDGDLSGGWDNERYEKLWRYNLHYFDDLNAEGAAERRDWHEALIRRWIGDNPPAAGTGWESYPTSLRIVNWIKWALAGNALPPEAVLSLAVQTRWLARRLEFHLLGNHLFANAKALVFAGLFFSGDEAERWLTRGLAILAREIDEQILPDGGQFELSPMYHALALEDVLDLVNLGRAFPAHRLAAAERWADCAGRMRRWLAVMSHPDGEISFFNDAAIGIAPAPSQLDGYAIRLGLRAADAAGQRLTHLADSGYIRVETGDIAAILDCARIGPDYLPGHAHADTLSFELSVGGRRVLVNSGTSEYGLGPERLRQRGTRAHNTVTVDGADSSEVWSGFRVARRARPLDLVMGDGKPIKTACSHDGYRRLPGRPLHRRSWTFGADGLQVEDRVAGVCSAAEARFHFHPDVAPTMVEDACSGRVAFGDGRALHWCVAKGKAHLETSSWHPEFGTSIPTTCLVVALVDGASHLILNCRSEEEGVQA